MASRGIKKRRRNQASSARGNAATATPAPVSPGSPVARAQPAASGWIISPFWDSVLFIGAPAVSIAILFPLSLFWESGEYAVFLLAFLTFGHHFPGFVRAYGDRELFWRYKWRFLLAPPLFFAAAYWFEDRGLHGILMLGFTWDIWHVLMQHYGFMRIYDAKQREIGTLTARLDWLFSISGYLALIIASPHYRNNLLYLAYQSGIPVLPMGLFTFLQNLIYLVALVSAVAYVGYTVYLWRQGRHNIRKLAALAFFMSATYYLYIYNHDFVVGFAVWSGFHCLQYYGIVWAFNRSRVERGGEVTRFVRFLFRPKVGLAILYSSLIFAYGGLDYLKNFLDGGTVRTLLGSFIGASTILHYYFDGFIWKVREKDTREPLNINISVGEPGLVKSSTQTLRTWARRLLPSYKKGLYQAGYVMAFLVLVGSLETQRPNDDLTMHRALATVAAGAEEAHLRLGESLSVRGQTTEALGAYRQAVELNPEYAKAHVMLGVTLASLGRIDEAVEAYRQALEFQPGNAVAHFNLAAVLEGQGHAEEALHHYQQATQGTDSRAEQLAREAILRLQTQR